MLRRIGFRHWIVILQHAKQAIVRFLTGELGKSRILTIDNQI